MLNNLRVTGPTAPGPGSLGMKLFRPKAALSGGTSTASSQHCRAAPAPAVAVPIVRAADVFLAAHVAGMTPQVPRGSCTAGRLVAASSTAPAAVSQHPQTSMDMLIQTIFIFTALKASSASLLPLF